MTDFTGRQLDSYRIDTLVGQSSVGAVYRAIDLKQGRPVRLTVVDRALVPDPSVRQCFQQQIELAIRLAHPAIVKVLDHGENEDRVYFVTEPETAHKLGAVLERISSRGHVIQLDETLYLMAQVADALVLAHRHGCIHGHLQPDNILLERLARGENKPAQETFQGSLQARVTGFGLNSLVNTHWLDNQVEALPYLSPEQCMGQEAGDRSDIYALGAILYTLATGRPPLSVASAAEANRPTHDCGEKPPAPQEVHPGLPATVAAIIHKAMARQPGERFRTVDQMLYALRQARALLTETTQERFSPPDKTTSLVAHLLTTAMDDTAAEDVIQ
ncbi:MAG TPA: serine/threonine-protein kinase, partial [Anaerolineae bacterium]